MKYQVYLALIAGTQSFKLIQHSGVRFTDNEVYRSMTDLIGTQETNEVFNTTQEKSVEANVDKEEEIVNVKADSTMQNTKYMGSERAFQESISGLIGKDEAMEVSNQPESSFTQQRGTPVNADPVLRVNPEGSADSLGLHITMGGQEISIAKKDNKGVPVLVDPVIRTNTEGDANLGLNMRVGGDQVSVEKKAKSTPQTNEQKLTDAMAETIGTEETKHLLAQQKNESNGVPVLVNPIIAPNEVADTKLGVTGEIGGDMISFMKHEANLEKHNKPVFSQEEDKTLPDETSEGPASKGLKDVKITVSGDKVSGMNGDETVYGNASVTGTQVVYNKKQSLVQSSGKQEPEGAAITQAIPVFKELKDQKISVGGDRVSGMNGDEVIRGPAVVTGTHVVYNQNTKSNGVATPKETEIQIDGTPIELLQMRSRGFRYI